MPTLYIIGGANGSGKTTIALQLLPQLLGIVEYVNADAIAAGLSPLNPAPMAMTAGRLMLKRLQDLVDAGSNFAFESTLASRSVVPFLQRCKTRGYTINLIYIWLPNPDLSVQRVAYRVASGGHNIPEADIRRRYERSRQNLIALYLPLCDSWVIYNNAQQTLRRIAAQAQGNQPVIYDQEAWSAILGNTDDKG